ncbi:hypothetical protein C7I85_25210 [Mesorhizobium soli]|uniref:Uncharacterized protein n=1 Tax=Pseudaminobacter soli (ex Li et al. 2025) TaxID=1295366 RepID=A0A2P7S1E3_9HYPH|nr:hypothetical protein C7I85_25210 [Mesorhizobium soli]
MDVLDALMQRAVDELQIVDLADQNEFAARILSLFTVGGRSFEDILEIAIRLHRNDEQGRHEEARQHSQADKLDELVQRAMSGNGAFWSS